MSQAAELAATWNDAFMARDVDRMIGLANPDIELALPGHEHQGHEGGREFMEGQTWGVAGHVGDERFFGREGSLVAVVAVRFQKRSVGTGAVASARDSAATFEISDGRIRRWSVRYPDLEAALRAAGLTLADEIPRP